MCFLLLFVSVFCDFEVLFGNNNLDFIPQFSIASGRGSCCIYEDTISYGGEYVEFFWKNSSDKTTTTKIETTKNYPTGYGHYEFDLYLPENLTSGSHVEIRIHDDYNCLRCDFDDQNYVICGIFDNVSCSTESVVSHDSGLYDNGDIFKSDWASFKMDWINSEELYIYLDDTQIIPFMNSWGSFPSMEISSKMTFSISFELSCDYHFFSQNLSVMKLSRISFYEESGTGWWVYLGISLGAIIAISVVCCCAFSFFCFFIFFILCVGGGFGLYTFTKPRAKTKSKNENDFELKLQNLQLQVDEEQENDKDFNFLKKNLNSSLFRIQIQDLNLIKLLGSGGGGSVFLAEWNHTKVAYKQIHLKKGGMMDNESHFIEFQKEIQILDRLNHPNIVHFYGALLKFPRCGFVMEFCSNGDLKDFLSQRKGQLCLEQRMSLVLEIVFAMEFLHSQSIIHRDLKLENVLIDEKEHAKLMDFGLSRSLKSLSVSKTKGVGTSLFMAPEIVRGEDYDEKVDQFSFSICLYEILLETFEPYEGKPDFVEYKVANDPNMRPNVKNVLLHQWMKDLLKNTWDHEASNRKSFEEIAKLLKKERKKVEKLKKSKTIYLCKEGNEEGEEDFEIQNNSFNQLLEIANRKFGSAEEEERKFWIVNEKGGKIEMMNERDFEMLENDAFLYCK